MDKIIVLLLLALGLGAAHLAIGGLLKLGPQRQEFWLFGLGVRTKFGAFKVLLVAIALLLLSYSSYKRGSVIEVLEPDVDVVNRQVDRYRERLQAVESSIQKYESQIKGLTEEREACQEIVNRQGLGLANQNDQVGELKAVLGLKQKEITDLQSNVARLNTEMESLRGEQEAAVKNQEQTKTKLREVEDRIENLQSEKSSLLARLESTSNKNEADLKQVVEENKKLKSLYRDEERRASLLRQGLALREANDWSLEQEIQRLANILSDQPDISSTRQTDIARALQRINQVLREGAALTKQAKAADAKPQN